MELLSNEHISIKDCSVINDNNYSELSGEYKFIVELIRDSLYNVKVHNIYWHDSWVFLKGNNGMFSYYLSIFPDSVAQEVKKRVTKVLEGAFYCGRR